ncbi:MAG TPA: 3-dehydroquinate dehydratase [Peptococcaceae bacterium]|nr:3-dehydroquinate dehydratase [Peptococcaceae bacterium]
MIESRELTKKFGNVTAVNSVSFDVKEGELFAFLGPNGAGKTTTIKMITGVLPIDTGTINVNGHDIDKDPIKAKMSMGYVPDTHDIYDRLTGIEYLNFIADVYEVSRKERKQNIEKYLDMFEMKQATGQPIKSYSHGMKQKLLISAALLPEPAVFILDEPLSGLDPKSARTLKRIMVEHSQKGGTVLFSSHILEVVENLCDRVGIIKNGVLIACDSLENLKKHSAGSLEDIFMELTENE